MFEDTKDHLNVNSSKLIYLFTNIDKLTGMHIGIGHFIIIYTKFQSNVAIRMDHMW
jgi:hypothetical protein